MFGLGLSEILVIAVIAIVFIGPDQLPDVARTIGRFLNDIKRSTDSLKDDFKSQINLDLEERKREIFSDQNHTRQIPLPPEDTHISPHETDPMLSDRQHELEQLELSAIDSDNQTTLTQNTERKPDQT
jgi:sec-independent protein translocase protein TatB